MHYCLEPLGNYCIRFWPVQSCPKSIKTKLHRIFPDEILSGAFQATLHRVLTCAMLSRKYQSKIAQDFFIYNVFWSLWDNITYRFYLHNVVPRVLRQHCTGVSLMQCCLEPLRQHCIGFWPVQCYPRSIKTTLDRIFSYAMLSGASWAIPHRVFSCPDVVPSVLRQHCTGLFLMQCCLELFGQHCIDFWPAPCCPKSIKAKLYRTFFYAILSGASQTTLHSVFICTMLSQEY